MPSTRNRGFASMDRDQQREIASKGGKAAHQKGTAHEFTSEEARLAGSKGGKASQARRQKLSISGQEVDLVSPAHSGRLFELIKRDHHRICELLDQMNAPGNQNFDLQDELYPILRREWQSHTVAEENSLYVALRSEDPSLSAETTTENDEIRALILRLDSLFGKEFRGDNQQTVWMAAIEELRAYFRNHFEQEEAEVFHALSASPSLGSLEDLAEKYEATKTQTSEHAERAA